MKTRTKVLILALSAILLVVTTVFATVAYLQSSVAITNTFSVGNVTITMDETKVDNLGVALTGGEAGRTSSGQDYKLFPGRTYTKDPLITVVAGSEDCWLFVKVQNGIVGIEDGTTIADQMETNGWVQLEDDEGNDVTNVYTKAAKIDSSNEAQTFPVFGGFTVKSTVDGSTLAGYGEAEIVVTAYAVQADGFATPYAAWAATYGV